MATEQKKEIWSKEDEKYFLERYLQAENKQPQYLLSKAFALFFCNDPSIHDRIVTLLDKYFADFPCDKEGRASALQLMGKIYYSRKDFDKTFEFYKKAAEFEVEYPEVNCGAWLAYAEHIVRFKKTEFFDEAEKYVSANYDKLDYAEGLYQASAILAVICGGKGDLD